MKANELMIGDWVCVANGNVKISSVNYQGYAKYRLNECDIAISSDCLDCAEPIQLTKEILKANGWEVMGKDIGMVRCLYRLSDKERIRIYLHYPYMLHYVDDTRTDGYEEREWSIGNITKVHELQHALRICGLDELADNFKLTTTELKKL